MEPVQHHHQRQCLRHAGHWQVAEEPHRYGHQLPTGIQEHQWLHRRLWRHHGPARHAYYHGHGGPARHGAANASDGERHGGCGFLERWRRDGVMLRLTGGEGGRGHLACWLAKVRDSCMEPVLEEASTTVILLATGPALAGAPNCK
jgi:hypothetical protein